MTEDESYKENLDYIRGQIETLKQILRVTVATMTDEQRAFIYTAAKQYSERTEEHARNVNTDIARNFASAAYEESEEFMREDGWIEEFKQNR